MTYAGTRRVVDADSHLMEWPTFLSDHADPRVRDRLPVLPRIPGVAEDSAHHSDEQRSELLNLGDQLLRRGPKWGAPLGAVFPEERSDALDLLGFEHQVVYSSFCATLFSIHDPEVRYAAYRAHNRAMAEFCQADERLHGVGLCDLDEIDNGAGRSMAELDAALDLGLAEIWIPARAPGGRSPGHADHDL